MSPDTTDSLTRLLITFDAQRLGEGDVFAGANVIAAMACTIANRPPPWRAYQIGRRSGLPYWQQRARLWPADIRSHRRTRRKRARGILVESGQPLQRMGVGQERIPRRLEWTPSR